MLDDVAMPVVGDRTGQFVPGAALWADTRLIDMLSGPAPLRIDELEMCQELSREAGWNQNGRDWRFLIESGVSFGLRRDARLVATAGIIPYGRFGWICMVLVSAGERRQGIASRLMQECMEWLKKRGR